MEKEIYLTEALIITDTNESAPTFKEKQQVTSYIQRADLKKQKIKRMLEQFPLENYYDDKKIKPGLSLYKAILDIEDRRASKQYNGPELRMHIPETILMNQNSNSMIYVQNDVVKVESFVSGEAFIKKISQNKDDGIVYPKAIVSNVAGIAFGHTIFMNNQVTSNKIMPRSEALICRKFVEPFAMTPNLLRLFYISKTSKQVKKNYAYKIVNLKQMDEQIFKKKHRLIHHYIVNTDKDDSYSVTLLKGKSLQRCEDMAASLVQYLEKAISIKIQQMAIDFTIDQNKQLWFFELKGIKSKTLTKLWEIGNSQEIQLIAEQNNNILMCKLCGMMYSKHELQKIVTNKLITELVFHLKSRGLRIDGVPHLSKEGLSTVCSICYQLIVAEHGLIDIEKEFSNILNICPNSIERVKSPSNHHNKKKHLSFLSEEEFNSNFKDGNALKSWRLFFYIEKVKNYQRKDRSKPLFITLQMKFRNLKQKFEKTILPEQGEDQCSEGTKMYKSRQTLNTRAQSAVSKKSRITDFQTSHFMKSSITKLKSSEMLTKYSKLTTFSISNQPLSDKDQFSLQKVKIYVLYTKKSQTHHIFSNSSIEFVLTINGDKFVGRTSTLEELKNKDTCQRHSTEIFLFDDHFKHCNLELTVGLICDGEASSQEIDLREMDGLYFPVQSFSNCNPLPDEWMEVFTQGEEIPELKRQTQVFFNPSLMESTTEKVRPLSGI